MGRSEVILLDTPVLLWAALEPKRLSRTASAAIRRARRREGLAVAAVTLWELANLAVRGRIELSGTLESALDQITDGVIIQPLTIAVSAVAAQFPPSFPRDPADRLIAATAVVHGLTLITRDERLQSSPLLKTIW